MAQQSCGRGFPRCIANQRLPLRSSPCLALLFASHFVEHQTHNQIDGRTPRAHADVTSPGKDIPIGPGTLGVSRR